MLKLNSVLATFVALTLFTGPAFSDLGELEGKSKIVKETDVVVTLQKGDNLEVYIVPSLSSTETQAIAKIAGKDAAAEKAYQTKVEASIKGMKPAYIIKKPTNELEADGEGSKQACWFGGWGRWGYNCCNRWFRPVCFNYYSYCYRPCYGWGGFYTYC